VCERRLERCQFGRAITLPLIAFAHQVADIFAAGGECSALDLVADELLQLRVSVSVICPAGFIALTPSIKKKCLPLSYTVSQGQGVNQGQEESGSAPMITPWLAR